MAPDPQSREARQQRFAHFTELAIISVQEIVDFAKQLPGFLQLSREDQIALLKTSAIEVAGKGWGKGTVRVRLFVGGASRQPDSHGAKSLGFSGLDLPFKVPYARPSPLSTCARSAPCVQVMLLETARRYNPGSESITFLKDFSYNREDFAKAGEN